MFVALIVFASCSTLVQEAIASPDIIYSDSQDGFVDSLIGAVSNIVIMVVGDDSNNAYRQGFVKFSLSGVSGTLSSAILYLYVRDSKRDGVLDSTSPLTNPGLGDCLVRHIADYGTLGASDLDAPSIGNDPGVLLSSSATPSEGYASIDVTAAMQDDINNGRSFSSFMIKMSTNTDNDNLDDQWEINTSEETGTSFDPYIEYTLGPTPTPTPRPVGGVLTPVNKLTILAPYLALIGLVGAVTMAVAAKRRRRS